jgi:hypothetical protein
MPSKRRSNYPSIDATLGAAAAMLRQTWRNVLTDAQRAAWSSYLAAHPPQDLRLTEYVTTEPTSAMQSQVTPDLQYAWSQIFAVVRFITGPRLQPTGFAEGTLNITGHTYTDSNFDIALDLSPRPITPTRILSAMSPLLGVGTLTPRNSVVPCCADSIDTFPTSLSLSSCWNAAFVPQGQPWWEGAPAASAGSVAVTVAWIDNNNMLRPSPDCLLCPP